MFGRGRRRPLAMVKGSLVLHLAPACSLRWPAQCSHHAVDPIMQSGLRSAQILERNTRVGIWWKEWYDCGGILGCGRGWCC